MATTIECLKLLCLSLLVLFARYSAFLLYLLARLSASSRWRFFFNNFLSRRRFTA
jgi:hypothetical protein